jgi:hypothetical protein
MVFAAGRAGIGSLMQRAAILHCVELSQTVEGQESLLLFRCATKPI